MNRWSWILNWLLGFAGLGFLLASFHVVPPFIFSLDDWALSKCLQIGYLGLIFGNLTLRPEDKENERMFTKRRVLMSLLCFAVAFVVCFVAWPFFEFPNEASVLYAAITAGGFSMLCYFVGALGFPVPLPFVLAIRKRFNKD